MTQVSEDTHHVQVRNTERRVKKGEAWGMKRYDLVLVRYGVCYIQDSVTSCTQHVQYHVTPLDPISANLLCPSANWSQCARLCTNYSPSLQRIVLNNYSQFSPPIHSHGHTISHHVSQVSVTTSPPILQSALPASSNFTLPGPFPPHPTPCRFHPLCLVRHYRRLQQKDPKRSRAFVRQG